MNKSAFNYKVCALSVDHKSGDSSSRVREFPLPLHSHIKAPRAIHFVTIFRAAFVFYAFCQLGSRITVKNKDLTAFIYRPTMTA